MSHFAEINNNNIVINVIVAEQDVINSGVVGDSFNFIQTSYNNSFRGKYAAVGDTWHASKNVFLGPQPYPSWTLDIDNNWQPPVLKTDDTNETWDEDSQTWIAYVMGNE
jgi:hypothetical protein